MRAPIGKSTANAGYLQQVKSYLTETNATGAVGGPRLPGKFVPIETSVTNGKSVHPCALLLRNVTKRIWKIGDIVDVPGKHHGPPKCY